MLGDEIVECFLFWGNGYVVGSQKSRKRVEVTSDEDSLSGSEKEKKPDDTKKRKVVSVSDATRPPNIRLICPILMSSADMKDSK